MKNFPHQFSNIEKLTEALRVAHQVVDRGAEFGRDAVFGEALARAGVYTFRTPGNIEEHLARERQKPRSNRGTETAAREMRRFLLLAGFIEHDEIDNTYTVTRSGEELLQATTSEVRLALWRDAMLKLGLVDAYGNVSHPYRILLRLVSDNPGIDTFKLMLAFEARTNSAEEYDRISDYLDLDFPDLIGTLGIGESNAKNAVKILPSIAKQVGDIRRAGRQSWPVARLEVAENGFEPITEREARRKTTPRRRTRANRRVDLDAIASIPDFGEAVAANVDLTGAIELIRRRTAQHQTVVRDVARYLADAGFELYEDPFDCLGKRENLAILIEAKTLDGSPSDERKQSERALGQIKGYTHFDLPEDVVAAEVREIIAFSQKPTDETIRFLNANDVNVLWPNERGEWFISRVDGNVVAFEPNGMA